jgi:hypothetical protein
MRPLDPCAPTVDAGRAADSMAREGGFTMAKSSTTSTTAAPRLNMAGARKKLTDQVAAFKRASKVRALVKTARKTDPHAVAENLRQVAFYPAHDKRAESPAYHKAHDNMVVKKDLPCLVCGVRHSTLGDKKKNPYAAKQLETHHHVIEWALANAIDPQKFNENIRPSLAHKHPQNPVYKKAMSEKQIRDWVDHSEDNLWVLCDVHHRAKLIGIHAITYPIWCPQDLLRPNFEKLVKKELLEMKGKNYPASGGAAKKPRAAAKKTKTTKTSARR